jgi:hypothetical protein
MLSPRLREVLQKLHDQLEAELAEVKALLGSGNATATTSKNQDGRRPSLAGALRSALPPFKGKDVLARTLAEAIDAHNSQIKAVERISTVTAQLFEWAEQKKHGVIKKSVGKPGKPTLFHIE